ncbi:PQQ-binding-like beta-propeller repeat protein [Actinoplanes sp. L3-i22]|uniref:outer membrane protein assembly factor BamB family protein n=1 Tax=Actinoplanes sp. L3-i22 TaxID=2836373 RepID=UPI001C747384|nr:PQQ-binding-like beta-propeller repeat protein [Actinoplanes sp. L3-i22]BCY14517.1 hypothetical protein L3i22_096050 [Actinoplanes sp. L3-i22]
MSTELDDLFTALSRQADALPIGTASQARRRGEQRRARSRAVLATTAAVVLILTGVGVVNAKRHRGAEPILPATTPTRVRGMTPVGSPVQPPAGQTFTSARISGTRVIGYTGSTVVALDATTGRTVWTLPGLDATYRGVATSENAVLLLRQTGTSDEPTAPVTRVLEIHDPATGAKRWELKHTSADQLVLHRDTLVRLVDGGRLEAYDLATGQTRWVSRSDAVLVSGMRTEADASEDADGGLLDPATGKVFPYRDDRVVTVTAPGRVVIRDIHTGKVRSAVQGRPEPQGLFAYEGMVYTEQSGTEGRAIGTPSKIVYEPKPPWYLEAAFPCGHDRLCAYESSSETDMRLTMVDATTGQVLRTTTAVPLTGSTGVRLGHVMTSSGTGSGTALYDESGQARYSDRGIGGFVDDGNALTLTRDAGDGRFTARGVSNIDFRAVTLGTMPEIAGRCDWTADLLTCPTQQGLYTWRFTR